MDISFLVTSHNEGEELKKVLDQLTAFIVRHNSNDEIVVLDDYSDNPKTLEILNQASQHRFVRLYHHRLNKDFGTHKTDGSRACKRDYIVQLDADEYLSEPLLENLRELLNSNPTVELYRVPRVNLLRGLTQLDALKWGWHVSDLPEYPGIKVINWHHGDYQSRIYKNSPDIKWVKKLHETVDGARVVTELPKEVDWAIIHDKTIERQRSQNEFYNQHWSPEANMGRG